MHSPLWTPPSLRATSPQRGEELPGYGSWTIVVYSDNPTGHNSPHSPSH